MNRYTIVPVRRLLLIIPLLLLILTAFALPVHALTFNIGCTAGVGDTAALVTAIDTANGDAADDTINLAANCVYTLAGDLPAITSSMTINGGGGTIIDGAGAHRPFTMSEGNVSINGLIIRNGYGSEDDTTASALLMSGGTLTVTGSTFTMNGPSTAAIIFNSSMATFISTTFDNNGWFVPLEYLAAANAIQVTNASVTLTNSTVTNHMSLRGRAIVVDGATMLISNSTIAFNNQGVYNFLSHLTINNSILANSAVNDCEQVSVNPTVITNSLVRSLGTILYCDVVNGVNGNLTDVDPKFKALTGSPAYLPIAADSPAYNAGNDSDIYPGLTTDQAGNTRVRDGTVDMGAFEAEAPAVAFDASSTSVAEGTSGTVTLRRYGGTTIGSQTVNLTLTRGANLTPGEYTISGGGITGQEGNVTVTIPGGSASVDLTFTALEDGSSAEPDNTLTVALASGVDYDIGFISSASAIIPANGLTVSTLDDNTTDEGTLRQAMLNANTFPSNDTITFVPGGTITLNSPLPDVAANGRIIINGGGDITISGAFAHRVFNVLAGSDLRLRDLTVGWGFAATDGGAIRNAGLLQLIGVTVIASDSFGDGGGIKNDSGGTLTLINSTIANNDAVRGGGIANSGTASLINSTIANNGAASSGTGLYNPGIATLHNSIIADNVGFEDCFGSVVAQNSLIEDGTCNLLDGVNGNKTGDPVLGALTGSPAYFPLLMTSPAINAGSNALVPVGIETDQPGNARISDTTVDMGAFESAPASLDLTLALQGRPAAPHATYVTDVQVLIRPAGSPTPLTTLNLVSDENGVVTIPGMTAWNYDIRVKGSHTLARAISLALVEGTNTLTTPILLEGDANNDNSVILEDFSLLAAAFGTSVGDPTYNAQADFNGDGVVQLVDFSLLASNFAQTGAP